MFPILGLPMPSKLFCSSNNDITRGKTSPIRKMLITKSINKYGELAGTDICFSSPTNWKSMSIFFIYRITRYQHLQDNQFTTERRGKKKKQNTYISSPSTPPWSFLYKLYKNLTPSLWCSRSLQLIEAGTYRKNTHLTN